MSHCPVSEDFMMRWLLLPLALVAVLVATPASQGRGCRSSCGNSCSSNYCVVGYNTELRTVISHEWVTEKRKVTVTEWKTEKEKQKVTRHKSETITEKKPYTYFVSEMQKQSRTEEYWVCEAITVEEDRVYTVHEEIRTPKKGTRKVYQPTVVEETRKVTVDRGHYETQCYERTCYSRKGCCGSSGCCYTTTCYSKVWVPALVTEEQKVKVHKSILVEQPYEYVEISYKPVEKKEKVKVTKFQQVKKSRPVEYWVCVRKEMKGEHTYSYVKWTPVVEEVLVDVQKPYPVVKEVDVKVCRAVEKKVEVKVPIYGCVSPSGCCK